jgi:hypothetical protein
VTTALAPQDSTEHEPVVGDDAGFPEEYLAEGRWLAAMHSEHRWELGDLALLVEPMGKHGGAAPGRPAA